MELFDGSDQYGDQLELLKQRLGKPLPIRHYLLEHLEHFRRDKVLLDEVSLELIERHYDELHLVGSQKRIADELIQESKFKLASYWIRYDKLKHAYDMARTEELEQKQKNRALESEKVLRELLVVVAFLGLCAMIGIEIFRGLHSLRP
jgi:hypothetical protein